MKYSHQTKSLEVDWLIKTLARRNTLIESYSHLNFRVLFLPGSYKAISKNFLAPVRSFSHQNFYQPIESLSISPWCDYLSVFLPRSSFGDSEPGKYWEKDWAVNI